MRFKDKKCYIFSELGRVYISKKKKSLFAHIPTELLHTDNKFEQIKRVLFAHVNPALNYNRLKLRMDFSPLKKQNNME